MLRFLLGCIVGALGGAYFLATLLSATPETPPTRTNGGHVTRYRGIEHDLDTWTGPIT